MRRGLNIEERDGRPPSPSMDDVAEMMRNAFAGRAPYDADMVQRWLMREDRPERTVTLTDIRRAIG